MVRRLETNHLVQTHRMIVLDKEFTILGHTLMEFPAVESMRWSYQQRQYQRIIDAASHDDSPINKLSKVSSVPVSSHTRYCIPQKKITRLSENHVTIRTLRVKFAARQAPCTCGRLP